jgi:hypothetical protein
MTNRSTAWVAGLTGAVGLSMMASSVPLARGALAADAASDTAQSTPCDRACLDAIAEQYLAAMVSHDPSKAPLAPGARYTENGVDLALPDGLWRTAQSVGTYRLFVTDPKAGSVGFLVKAQENGAPLLVGTRLAVVHDRITEIESIVARLGATVGGGPSTLARTDELGANPRKQFLTALPPNRRRTRAQLAAIVNRYFSGIENNTGDKPPPFADDCMRLENGTQTSGRPTAAGAAPGPLNYSCKEAFRLGYYREDTRLRNRRVLAVDEERGLVYTGVYFDHDATVRSYLLKNGRTATTHSTAPWTWAIQEIFEVNADGQLSQIEAVLTSVPYGMRPGWSTGLHLPSAQVQREHFKEY